MNHPAIPSPNIVLGYEQALEDMREIQRLAETMPGGWRAQVLSILKRHIGTSGRKPRKPCSG